MAKKTAEKSTVPTSSVIKTKTGNSIYLPGEFAGKSLVHLKKESNGQLRSVSEPDVYDKWSQAPASSVELAERANSLSEDSKNYPDKVLSMVMPVVVMSDGLLWRVSYDQAGQIPEDPALEDECEFFVDRKFHIEVSGWIEWSKNEFSHSLPLQRTAAARCCSNRRTSWLPSLGRSAAIELSTETPEKS